ncbi:MAG: TIGR03000 domain-containing protein [Thermoguttaceae bacterium]
MSAQSNRMTLAFSGAAILAILCGGKAFCQSATPASPATNALPPVVHYHFHQHNYPGSLPGSSPYWAATASQVPNAFSPVPYAASPLNTQDPSGASAYGPAAYNQNPYTFIPMNALGGQGLPYSGSPGGWRPTAAWPYPAGYVPGPYAPLPFANTNPNVALAKGVVHVFLPTADAIVLLNGQKIRGTGKDRKLTTPPLPGNREFQYWVTATFNRGGQTVTEYRKVDLGAGEYTVADFTIPPEPNPIKLPAGPVDPNSVAPSK